MSVNAATTVSTAPSAASLPRTSGESLPAVPPGPTGPSALTGYPPSTATTNPLSIRRDLVLLERANRPLVSVLRRYEVPDPEDQRNDDGQRRVVDGRGVESILPGQTNRGVR